MADVPLIELQDVHKSFGEKHVLRGFSLKIEPGETFVMLGRSGSGKSVTLKTIVGLIRPDSGHVRVGEVDVVRADREALRGVRRQVAYLFQTGALVNWMTVRENVALPLVERRRLSKQEIGQRVEETLKTFGLLEAADQNPDSISGGMRKRAALCRVLVQEPAAILYDEPTAGLDPILSRTVSDEIQKAQRGELRPGPAGARSGGRPEGQGRPPPGNALRVSERELQSEPREPRGNGSGKREKRSALVVTHDLDLAFAVADRIGLHHEGRLIEAADPETFKASQHPAVREFLDAQQAPIRGDSA